MSDLNNRGSVAIAVVSWNREPELRRLLDSFLGSKGFGNLPIYVLDNGSEPSYCMEPSENLTIFRSEENLGCAEGRNFLSQRIAADFIFHFDDDGVLTASSSPNYAIECMNVDPKLAAVGGLVCEGSRTRNPWRRAPKGFREADFLKAPGFVGGCVLLRRSAFEEAGGYSTDSRYGGEEFSISARLMLLGWNFAYSNTFVLSHFPSCDGRLPDTEWVATNYRSRVRTADLYFGNPMRTSLKISAAISHWRSLKSLPTIFSRDNRNEIARNSTKYVGRIRLWNLKMLKVLGLRAWI